MRRLFLIIAIATMFLLNNVQVFAENTSKIIIDKDVINQGYIKVGYSSDNGHAVKIIIEKESKKYVYSLRTDGISENFPLQMGNGDYNISILENKEGNSYNVVYEKNVNVSLNDVKSVFLNPVQNINWNDSMKAIKKSKELTKNLKTEIEKITAIYNYIVSNFNYDYEKFRNLPSEYIPTIDDTLLSQKGICYDFSSLFASMLRSANIPTKLVKGYSVNVRGYHAWNEVYINSKNKWVTIDTSYDSQMKTAKVKYSMLKDGEQYSPINQY